MNALWKLTNAIDFFSVFILWVLKLKMILIDTLIKAFKDYTVLLCHLQCCEDKLLRI